MAQRPRPLTSPSGEDLLEQLRQKLRVTITSDGQDREHWRLAERVVNERLLVGLRKEEIERKLGPGVACGSPWPCTEGLQSEDRYYEVGRLPQGRVGGTHLLLIDFDQSGICIASRVVHTQ